MIRSMTGFGRSEVNRDQCRIIVEMRAVNHRFCEIITRLPKEWVFLEDMIKKQATEKVRRGRVELSVTIEATSTQASSLYTVNWQVADQYMEAAKQLETRFGIRQQLSVNELLNMPGVLVTEAGAELPPELVTEWLSLAVAEATAELLAMKCSEGEKLWEDLSARLDQIIVWTEQMAALSVEAINHHRNRLSQRIADLAGDLEIEPHRLAQEVVLFADRADISEETTRLRSHCAQFSEQLENEQVVGRKLDFLLQEMNREANTIGSKANYLPIQRLAVEVKAELEKMREQVQNVE